VSVTSGAWRSSVTPSAEYYYVNGLIFRYTSPHGGTLTRGVERLTLSVGYSGQTRMALSEFLPRWGLSARVSHTLNPTNRDFRTLWSASLGVWLPGVVPPHSLRVRGAWQQAAGGDDAQFMFRMKDVFPRGALYNFASRRWMSGSMDYQLPVWYPEGGIPGVLYFKRVRVNLFGDYARWSDFGGRISVGGLTLEASPTWHGLYSYGGDLILDMSPLRLPATNTFTAIFTFAKPSDQAGVFFNFGLSIPL
jgi:hypothetical protein